MKKGEINQPWCQKGEINIIGIEKDSNDWFSSIFGIFLKRQNSDFKYILFSILIVIRFYFIPTQSSGVSSLKKIITIKKIIIKQNLLWIHNK